MARIPAALCIALLVANAALARDPRVTSPDGRLQAKATGKVVDVFTTAQPARQVMSIRAHTEDVTALAYAPDGKMLFSADKGGKTNVMDAATGKLVRTFKGPAGVSSLAVSADGRTLTVKGQKETKKFDMATGAEVK